LTPLNPTVPLTVHLSEHPTHKEITIISVKGFIDTTTAPEFERYFLSALNKHQYKLVVDLKDVDYISSAGWGIFVSELKRIRQGKGDLVLVGMNPEVTEIFELLEFTTFLKTYPNVEEAVGGSFGVPSAAPPKDGPAIRHSKETK
jgi:anti-anti-sigma factor